MKRLVLSVFVAICGLSASAQSSLQEMLDEYHAFNHLDASITLGTTGIGFDLSTPVGDYAQLRLGYAFMPSFHKSVDSVPPKAGSWLTSTGPFTVNSSSI